MFPAGSLCIWALIGPQCCRTCTVQHAQEVVREYLAELVEDGHALALLHLAVQGAQGTAGPQPPEGLVQVLGLLAGAHKHQHLGLQPASQHLMLSMQITVPGALQLVVQERKMCCRGSYTPRCQACEGEPIVGEQGTVSSVSLPGMKLLTSVKCSCSQNLSLYFPCVLS